MTNNNNETQRVSRIKRAHCSIGYGMNGFGIYSDSHKVTHSCTMDTRVQNVQHQLGKRKTREGAGKVIVSHRKRGEIPT